MRKVTVTLPGWIGTEEAQEEVVRNLRAHALLKMEFYRSKMKLFEAKYGTTFSRFQRRVNKSAQEDFTAWDDLMEWEACYRAYQEWPSCSASRRGPSPTPNAPSRAWFMLVLWCERIREPTGL